MFKRMIVAVDGSDASEAGVRWAVDAAGDETTLIFCSVLDGGVFAATARALGDAAVSAARSRGMQAQSVVLVGQPAPGILGCARDQAADAIVIGSHGRTGIARVLIGSVAEAVIRGTDVPVVVAHADDHVRSGPIAVAVDDSAASDAALIAAIALARAVHAELRLFHVFGRGDFERIDGLGEATDERIEHASIAAAAILDEAGDRVRALGIAFEAVMLEGHPAPELLKVLESHGCSCVATGTHGRSGFKRLLFGSVAAALVEYARIPVIVARRTE